MIILKKGIDTNSMIDQIAFRRDVRFRHLESENINQPFDS